MADTRLDIQIKTTADTAGATQAEQALRKVDSAAKQAGQGTATAGQAAKTASADIRGLSQAGAGLNQTMSGLSQGGVTGLINAFRGLANVVKGLAASALGGVLLPILASAAAAFAYLSKKANENAAAISKMYKDGAEQAKAYEASLKEVKEAAEKSLEAQLQAVNRLADGYKQLIASMDEAASRIGNLRGAEKELALSKIDRDEAAALAGAKTDKERESIKLASASARAGVNGQYGRAAIENDVLGAKVREENANRAISQAAGQQFEADKAVSAAQQNFDNAISRIGRNPAPEDLVQAKRAKAELDAAKQNQAKVRDSLAPTIANAEREIASAQQVRELAPLRSQTQANQTEAERFGRQTALAQPARDRIPDLDARMAALYEEDRNLPMGWESERRGQIATELQKVSAERDAAYQAISNFAQSETKARADLERTLKNTSESSAGR